MYTSTDNPGFLARQQEQQTLPKILAYGIGGSLVFHGIAAIAFNYLPQHNSLPVEVTIIDPSEIPANLKPSPSPTITPPPKIKPTPALVAKATPTPTPSVEIKPTPTPTPSLKVKPTPIPTPAVKVKPEEIPPVVKIVTRSAVPVIPTRKEPEPVTLDDFNQQQNSNLKSKTDPVTQQNQRDRDFADRQIPAKNSSNDPPNGTQFFSRDAGRSNKIAKLFDAEFSSLVNNSLFSGNESNQNDTFNNLGSPGGENGNQGSTPENIGSRNGDKIATSRTGGGIPGLAGDGGSGGVSSDNGAEDVAGDGSPGSGGGSRSNSGGTGGSNGSSLKPSRGGKSSGGFGNGSGFGGDGFGDSSGFDIALLPGGSGGGSRSNLVGTGGGGGNGSSLKPSRGGKPGGSFGNGSGFGGDGYGDGSGSDIAANPGGGGVQSSKGFGSGLECLANCQPSYPQEIEYGAIVAVSITLDDSGQVIATKLSKPSKNKNLNNFAQTEFGRMRFKIPENLKRRDFPVRMNFKETR